MASPSRCGLYAALGVGYGALYDFVREAPGLGVRAVWTVAISFQVRAARARGQRVLLLSRRRFLLLSRQTVFTPLEETVFTPLEANDFYSSRGDGFYSSRGKRVLLLSRTGEERGEGRGACRGGVASPNRSEHNRRPPRDRMDRSSSSAPPRSSAAPAW